MHTFDHRAVAQSARLTAAFVALVSVFASPTAAHLALVRQGGETAGAREPGDRHGESIAVGDFDGNGYKDLAAGASYDEVGNVPGAAWHGAVSVTYGTLYGLTWANPNPDIITAHPDFLGDTNMRFGAALAAGDFDNDGDDDLAVGTPWINAAGGITDAGGVFIHEGTGSGLAPNFSRALAGDLAASETFGAALVAGFFDDDEYEDLAVGAPGALGETGKVFVFYGSADGLTMTNAKNHAYTQLDWLPSAQAQGGFATVLAAGHFRSDARDELIIGAPWFDRTVEGQGQIFIAQGGPTGLTTNPTEKKYATVLGGTTQSDAFFGWSITVGQFIDVPGGYGSVAIGEPGRSIGGESQAGRVYIIEGAFSGLNGDITMIDQSDAECGSGNCAAEAGDFFGAAMAAGRFTIGSYDDLAVSATGEDISAGGLRSNAGIVNVFYGSSGGIPSAGGRMFHGGTLDYDVLSGTEIGSALAFGRFDWNATGRVGLAIGAPKFDGESGLVYIASPWRQVFDFDAFTAISRDCEGSVVYSRRPLEEVQIASTTKIMTTLLACEAIEAGQISPNVIYQVPDWVANNVSGSSANLVGGEQDSFLDMMKMCMTVSGNDAAYAIADIMTPGGSTWVGHFGTVPEFVQLMNDRASSLGLGNTYFTNPAGLDVVDDNDVLPYSTARDMSLLGRFALQNDLFREIVSANSWIVNRALPTGGGQLVDVLVTYQNGFTQGVKSVYDGGNGTKGGSTPLAGTTGVFSGVGGAGDVVASSFGTPSGQLLITPAGGLLNLAQSKCDVSLPYNSGDLPVQAPAPPSAPFVSVSQILALPGSPKGGITDLTSEGSLPYPLYVELYRSTFEDPDLRYDVDVTNVSQLVLPIDSSTMLGIGRFEEHAGLTIWNRSDREVTLEISLTHPAGVSFTQVIASETSLEIPAYSATTGDESAFEITITNAGSAIDATLEIEERYAFAPSLGLTESFRTSVTRSGEPTKTSVQTVVWGADPDAAADMAYLVVRTATSVVEVGDPDPFAAPRDDRIGLLAARPTPFGTETTLRFELLQPGRVDVHVYDVSGRRVRSIVTGAAQAALLETRWDGRDDAGHEVPSGVYYVEARRDGRQIARGHVIRTR